jgi:hypothetical protein
MEGLDKRLTSVRINGLLKELRTDPLMNTNIGL